MDKKTFRSRPLDLAVDTISEKDLEEFISWLRQYPRLTMAEETRRFEEEWARWQGCRYAVACNSGSSANLLMYAALDTAGKAGGRKVVVPATGWVTTVAPALQLGFKPIMCESDSQTFGLDVGALETILKRERPDAVIVVHVLGVPANLSAILQLQQKYGFQLMEDCCASHGALHQGKKVGRFGLMSSFSFYYGHHMSTVEGGVVCTDDEEVYHHLLMLRSHGWLKDLPAEKAKRIMDQHGMDSFHAPFLFVLPGYNLRPTDINSFIGRVQLKRLDETVELRARNHKLYVDGLGSVVGYAHALPGDHISSISFCALAASTEERRKIVTALERNDIDSRIFTAGNLGRHPFWTERYGTFKAPMADRLYECGFFLPNNQAINPQEIEFICTVVKEALRS